MKLKVLLAFFGLWLMAGSAQATSVLMLDQTVCTGCAINENTVATGLGYTITTVNAAQWASMSTAQFAAYDAIIIGDDGCNSSSILDPLQANRATWSAAATGNVVVLGFDPGYHSNEGTTAATTMMQNSIAWATKGGSTGLYLPIACYNRSDVLQSLGTFVQASGESDSLTILVPGSPTMAGLTSATVSGWGTSAHTLWSTVPSNFSKVIVDSGSGDAAFVTRAPVAISTPIPALSPWLLGALVALLATGGFVAARSRS